MLTDHSSDNEIVGLWLSLSELAFAKGVGKPALSERVARLERQGLITTRPGKGRQKLINVAEFDRVVGQVTDLARDLGTATRRQRDDEEPEKASSSATAAYRNDQARRIGYLADIAGLDLAERRGELVKAVEIRPLIAAAGQKCAQAINSLEQEAEPLRVIARNGDLAAYELALQAVANRIAAKTTAALHAILSGHRMPPTKELAVSR